MTIRVPKETFTILPAYSVPTNAAQTILFIGQKTAIGSATTKSLYQGIANDGSWNSLFGKTSELSAMIRNFKKINKISKLDVIPLDPGGTATPASTTITFDGTATESKTIHLVLGSYIEHKFAIDIAKDDTAAVIAAKAAAAITADIYSPASASSTTEDLNLLAGNKGVEGNFITVQIIGSVAGISITAFAGFTGGTGTPDFTGVTDLINNVRYQTIVMPASYNVSALNTYLQDRFNTNNNILDGILHIGKTDTAANLVTYGNTFNSQSLNVIGNKVISDATSFYIGSAIRELDYNIGAQFAAIRALRLTDGTDISRYIISSVESRDAFGGIHIASLPYHNTPFSLLPVIEIGREFTDTEYNDLKTAGISVLGNNPNRTSIICGEMVTTYKTDPGANPDESYKYENYVDTISNIREYMYNGARAKWSQARLTDGDPIEGLTIATEGKIKSDFEQMYQDLSTFGLTRAGTTNRKIFSDNLIITLNLEEGKITASMLVPIVTQVRVINATIRISF